MYGTLREHQHPVNLKMGERAQSGNRFKIDKLSHNNYIGWSYRVRLLLEQEETWEVITRVAPEIRAEGYEAWAAKDKAARITISMLVEDSQLVYIRRQATARECWEQLREHHQHQSMWARVRIQSRIFSEKLKYGCRCLMTLLNKMPRWKKAQLSEL